MNSVCYITMYANVFAKRRALKRTTLPFQNHTKLNKNHSVSKTTGAMPVSFCVCLEW